MFRPFKLVVAIEVHRPQGPLSSSGPIVFEKKVPILWWTAPWGCVLPKVYYVIVAAPGMMAWVVIEIANIRTIRRHRISLKKIVRRVFDEGDKPA